MSTRFFLYLFLLSLVPPLSLTRAKAADNGLTDPLIYAERVLPNVLPDTSNKTLDLSFFDIPLDQDKSVVTSFSDAFLWASGSRTRLSTGSSGVLAVIYLDQVEIKKPVVFGNELVQGIYDRHFDTIKRGGSCTKFSAKSQSDSEDRTVLFVDRSQSFDDRLSCIYRYYRAELGFDPEIQMQDFGSTFTTDLRMLRCRKVHGEKIKILSLMRSGAC